MTTPERPPDPLRVRLDERSLGEVLLVRAVEETDREGILLTRAERERATAQAAARLSAGRAPGEEELAQFLRERARALCEPLGERIELVRALRAEGRRFPLVPFLLVLFGAGLAMHLVGATKEIHVVANPLMVLILWNLAVLVLCLVSAAHARAPGDGALARWFGTSPLVARGLRALAGGTGPARAALARAAAELTRRAAPLYAARGAMLMHMGAMALVLGALGGMYLRGLVLEYRVTWESTFLSQQTTERALAILFAPARLLSGIPLPPLEPGGGPAADWIHLYALSVLLVVLLPRSLLAARAARRARTLAGGLALDLGDAYFRHLSAAHRGQDVDVHLFPYACELGAQARDDLAVLLHDVFGARARVQAHAPLAYGTEAGELAAALGAREAHARLVLCFALAQTPESEVHARLVSELGLARPGEPALVIVDGTGYRERLGAGALAGARTDEHRRNWDRVLRAAGCEPLHVDLGQAMPAELVLEASARVRAREESWSTSP